MKKVFLVLALCVSVMAGAASKYTLVFNSSSTASDATFTTLEQLLFSGQKYVESFSKTGFAGLAPNEQGLKLASNNNPGSLTLVLKEDLTKQLDSIKVYAKGNDAGNQITVNGKAQSTTAAFKAYTFAQKNLNIELSAKSKKQVFVTKIEVYYTEKAVTPLKSITLNEQAVSIYKEQTQNLSVSFDPVDATDKRIVWTSSDPTKVSIEADSATAIITALGITTEDVLIIAQSKGDSTIADTCVVTVLEKPLEGNVYTLMKATSELKNGDQVIIARQASKTIMGVYESGNNIAAQDGVFSEDMQRVQDKDQEDCVYTLKVLGEGQFAFQDKNGKYLCYNPKASNANNMQAQTALDNNAKWTCNKVTDGMCDWANVGTTTRFIQYNANAAVFACYTGYGNVYVYYRHDEKAGSITPEPETITWEARIKDSAAHFSQEVTIAAEHLEMEMEVVIEQDSIEPHTYPETRIQHQGVFAASVNELPAEGGKVTVTFDIEHVALMDADSTISARLILTGLDGNTDIIEKTVPVTVKLLREAKKLNPISIDSMVVRGMKAVGGVAGSTVATSKDTCLLHDVVLVYQSQYEYIVKDETGYLAVASTIDANLGDTLSGVRGVFKTDHKRFSFLLCEADIVVKAGTGAPAPEVFTAMPQYRQDMSRYVRYHHSHFNGSGNITIGEQILNTLSNYGVEAPKDTETPYQVDGIVSFNGNNTTQLILTNVVKDTTTIQSVTGVELSAQSIEIAIGQLDTLKATVLPEDATNKRVTWGVEDATIVSVKEGVIRGLAEGQTAVWVKTEDGSFTDTCWVTVTPAIILPDVTWNIVQELDSLKEGVKVFFGNTAKDYVMGLYNYDVSKSNIRGVDAVYDELRHQVTVSESYAYTVHKDDEKFYFEDAQGRYLYVYNDKKNLSVSTELSNQNKWTVTVDDSVAYLKNVYYSSFGMYFNKTAANAMYSTYSLKDANLADIYLYSNNAPTWIEPVLVPEVTILDGTDTITHLLDFGEVVYDDGWGQEVDPYNASKTLTFKSNKDVRDSIYLRVKSGKAFYLLTEQLPAKGGTASVIFSTTKAGEYADSLFVDCGDIHYAIEIKAKGITQEEAKPKLTLSTKSVYLNPNENNYLADTVSFTFSVKNLVKPLYIKWEQSEGGKPSYYGEEMGIVAGAENATVTYGAVTNMGLSTRTDETITVSTYNVYTPGTYVSTLYFYTVDPTSKEDVAFDRVTITVFVDEEWKPMDVEKVDDGQGTMHNEKIIRDGQVLILRGNHVYTILGNKVQ